MSEKNEKNEKDTKEVEETVAVKTFKSLAKVPSYVSADILPNSNSSLLLIQTGLSQRDLIRKVKRVLIKQLVVSLRNDDSSGPNVTTSSFPSVDLGDVALYANSQSGERLVTLRSVSGGKGKNRYVEIWRHGNLESIIDVTDTHEDFYTDDNFGSLRWSKDEKKIVYIAERKPLEESNEKKYDYVAGWGEKLVNRQVSVIVIVDVSENKARVLPFESHEIDPGQVLFGPEDETLIFTGYYREPRQFGLAACTNRQSGIFQSDHEGENLVLISNQVEHARSPRMNLAQNCLVYLSNPSGGPHARCSELYAYEFSSKENRLVVPIVRSPSESFHENFPGIYCGNILSKAFVVIDGAEFVLINSFWRSNRVVLAVNLTSGKVQNLTLAGSWNLFTVWDKYIVASQGLPNKFHQLNVGIITGNEENNLKVNWVVIDQPHVEKEVAETLSRSKWSILQPFADKPNLEIILSQPSETSSDRKPPLIVFPHGGPHGTSTAELGLYIQTWVSLGYAVIEVNYSGSTGFGQDYVDALIGKIGDLDIKEVQSSAQYFIDNNYCDGNSVVVVGGSHGGFISGHLIGKFPDFYKACVMRNPVLNIGGMSNVTDIPDWCFSELGLPYDLKKPPLVSPSDYAKMYESSPIANIDKIKTPILLMLGQNDKRVPHVDGLQWWYYLKSRGEVEISCKMYGETGHSLDTVEAEISSIDVICKFLNEKTGV